MASGSGQYGYINTARTTRASNRNTPMRVPTAEESGTPF